VLKCTRLLPRCLTSSRAPPAAPPQSPTTSSFFPANIVLTPPKITIALTKGDTFFSRWVSAPTDMPPVLKPSVRCEAVAQRAKRCQNQDCHSTQNRLSRASFRVWGISVASRRASCFGGDTTPCLRRAEKGAPRHGQALTKRALQQSESPGSAQASIRTERSG